MAIEIRDSGTAAPNGTLASVTQAFSFIQVSTLNAQASGFFYINELEIMFAGGVVQGLVPPVTVDVQVNFKDFSANKILWFCPISFTNGAPLARLSLLHFVNPQMRLDATHSYGLEITSSLPGGATYSLSFTLNQSAYYNLT
jgi:hypothetical protein